MTFLQAPPESRQLKNLFTQPGRPLDAGEASQREAFYLGMSLTRSLLTYIAVQCKFSLMKLEKELVAASSVPLILSILSEGDSYGYAIIQRVKELSGGRIEWTDGMLYPVLHWLEDHRMVRSRWEKAESGRKRKYYSIQAAGRQALCEQKEQWRTVTSTLNQMWRPQHA